MLGHFLTQGLSVILAMTLLAGRASSLVAMETLMAEPVTVLAHLMGHGWLEGHGDGRQREENMSIGVVGI